MDKKVKEHCYVVQIRLNASAGDVMRCGMCQMEINRLEKFDAEIGKEGRNGKRREGKVEKGR